MVVHRIWRRWFGASKRSLLSRMAAMAVIHLGGYGVQGAYGVDKIRVRESIVETPTFSNFLGLIK